MNNIVASVTGTPGYYDIASTSATGILTLPITTKYPCAIASNVFDTHGGYVYANCEAIDGSSIGFKFFETEGVCQHCWISVIIISQQL